MGALGPSPLLQPEWLQCCLLYALGDCRHFSLSNSCHISVVLNPGVQQNRHERFWQLV